jgi:hypothetical protein
MFAHFGYLDSYLALLFVTLLLLTAYRVAVAGTALKSLCDRLNTKLVDMSLGEILYGIIGVAQGIFLYYVSLVASVVILYLIWLALFHSRTQSVRDAVDL